MHTTEYYSAIEMDKLFIHSHLYEFPGNYIKGWREMDVIMKGQE